MAIILPGIMVSEVRNKLGNVVFINGRGGQAVRERVIPSNPNTWKQQLVRSFMTDLSQDWADTLTAPQREQWDAFGEREETKNAFNSKIALSGIASYVRSNMPLLNYNVSPSVTPVAKLSNAPANFIAGKTTSISPPTVTVSGPSLVCNFAFTAPAATANDFFYVSISKAVSVGAMSDKTVASSMRLFAGDAIDIPTIVGNAIITAPNDVALAVGNHCAIAISVLRTTTGRVSEPEIFRATVA